MSSDNPFTFQSAGDRVYTVTGPFEIEIYFTHLETASAVASALNQVWKSRQQSPLTFEALGFVNGKPTRLEAKRDGKFVGVLHAIDLNGVDDWLNGLEVECIEGPQKPTAPPPSPLDLELLAAAEKAYLSMLHIPHGLPARRDKVLYELCNTIAKSRGIDPEEVQNTFESEARAGLEKCTAAMRAMASAPSAFARRAEFTPRRFTGKSYGCDIQGVTRPGGKAVWMYLQIPVNTENHSSDWLDPPYYINGCELENLSELVQELDWLDEEPEPVAVQCARVIVNDSFRNRDNDTHERIVKSVALIVEQFYPAVVATT